MKQAINHELRVDMPLCDAYGYCAEMLHPLVVRDEWGYPIVTSEVRPEELEAARRAAVACPKLALRLAPASRSAQPAVDTAAGR